MWILCHISLYCPFSRTAKSTGPYCRPNSLKCLPYPLSAPNNNFLEPSRTNDDQRVVLILQVRPEICLAVVDVICIPSSSTLSPQDNSVIRSAGYPHFSKCAPTPSPVTICLTLCLSSINVL